MTGWRTRRASVVAGLADGGVLEADTALVATGTTPCVEALEGSGLDLEDGVLCDATLHAVGAEDVVVAGDVARWPNLRFDDVPRRVEHWITAAEAGQHAAAGLLAGWDARPFTPVPQFWSEQHGTRIQTVGLPVLGDSSRLAEGDPRRGRFVVTHHRDGQLVGAVAVASPRRLLHFRDLIGAHREQPASTGHGRAVDLSTADRAPLADRAAS